MNVKQNRKISQNVPIYWTIRGSSLVVPSRHTAARDALPVPRTRSPEDPTRMGNVRNVYI